MVESSCVEIHATPLTGSDGGVVLSGNVLGSSLE